MKKLLGMLGVVAVAIAIQVNMNSVNSKISNLSLVNLMSINVANAEAGGGDCDQCVVNNGEGEVVFSCKTVQGEKCKKSYLIYSVSCNNAKEC